MSVQKYFHSLLELQPKRMETSMDEIGGIQTSNIQIIYEYTKLSTLNEYFSNELNHQIILFGPVLCSQSLQNS